MSARLWNWVSLYSSGKFARSIMAYYWQIMSQHIHCVAKWLFTMANDPFIFDNSRSVWTPIGHTHSFIKTITSLFSVTSDAKDVKSGYNQNGSPSRATCLSHHLCLIWLTFSLLWRVFHLILAAWPYCHYLTAANCTIWLNCHSTN